MRCSADPFDAAIDAIRIGNAGVVPPSEGFGKPADDKQGQRCS
jgi:hypothetical protein